MIKKIKRYFKAADVQVGYFDMDGHLITEKDVKNEQSARKIFIFVIGCLIVGFIFSVCMLIIK